MELHYIIFPVNDKIYVLGKEGQYVDNVKDAMAFNEKIDAILYIEKHGYQKITTIRKINFKPKKFSSTY